MASTAFVVGFFTAMGWWSAHKLLSFADKPAVVQEQRIVIIKEEKKDVNGN